MKKLVVTMAALLFVVGCDNPGRATTGQSVLKYADSINQGSEYSVDLSCVVTKGNNSFVPLNTYFSRHDDARYTKIILDIEDEFEKQHPELRVTWLIEKTQGGRLGSFYVLGLWANHQPK